MGKKDGGKLHFFLQIEKRTDEGATVYIRYKVNDLTVLWMFCDIWLFKNKTYH